MVMILPGLLVVGPFIILVMAFVTPRRNWWIVYLSAFMIVSLFLLCAFCGVQELALSIQISRNGPVRPGRRLGADASGKMSKAGDVRAALGAKGR